jgi:hypothetical protein
MIPEYTQRPVYVQFVSDIEKHDIQHKMKYNSNLDINRINPLIGDYICIDHAFSLYMKVISRSWILINGVPEKLVIKLTDPCENHEYKDAWIEYMILRNKV